MVAVEIGDDSEFSVGSFGIREPLGPTADPSEIDVVLVPGLAFSAEGHRLGQGGGFYDKFLPLLRPQCLTIGVCFHEQVVPHVPGEEHDLAVDCVVTDRGPLGPPRT